MQMLVKLVDLASGLTVISVMTSTAKIVAHILVAIIVLHVQKMVLLQIIAAEIVLVSPLKVETL